MDNKLEILIKEAEGTRYYTALINHVNFLKTERIKLVGNKMRAIIGRPKNDVKVDAILDSVITINRIAKDLGVDFHINTRLNDIETWLRHSIMEDIGKEFASQESNT